jgi:RNA polymerase-binding transcription factor DksA
MMTEPSSTDRLSDQDLADFRLVLDDLVAALDQQAATERDGGAAMSGPRSFGVRDGVALERFADVTLHGRLLQQVAAVDRARTRLDDGTFGLCDVCGRQIAIARLEVIPWAEHCVGCVQTAR